MQKSNKKYAVIAIIMLVLLALTLYGNYVVAPLIADLAQEEVRAEVNNIINLANTYLQTLTLFYGDYFTVYYDSENSVSAIVANTGLINQVNMILKRRVQDQLNSLRRMPLYMPLGAFSGSTLISGFGAPVKLNAETVCNGKTDIKSDFIVNGINNIRHSLVIVLEVEIEILIPIRCGKSTVKNEIKMAETIIVGKIPDTILYGDSSSNYLDLLP